MNAVREPCTFSVIVPLYDCRDAGTAALRAAFAQTLPRHRFEVIAVVEAGARRARHEALLAQCDRVVESDADFTAVESEIALFVAGSRAASGDWLFFTEGHTVLDPDALSAIARHVEREPGCAIGIRPVPTWKSTAAAPTPTSDGPIWLPFSVLTPSPFWPWQNEQLTRNSSRPFAIWSALEAVSSADAGEKTA